LNLLKKLINLVKKKRLVILLQLYKSNPKMKWLKM